MHLKSDPGARRRGVVEERGERALAGGVDRSVGAGREEVVGWTVFYTAQNLKLKLKIVPVLVTPEKMSSAANFRIDPQTLVSGHITRLSL